MSIAEGEIASALDAVVAATIAAQGLPPRSGGGSKETSAETSIDHSVDHHADEQVPYSITVEPPVPRAHPDAPPISSVMLQVIGEETSDNINNEGGKNNDAGKDETKGKKNNPDTASVGSAKNRKRREAKKRAKARASSIADRGSEENDAHSTPGVPLAPTPVSRVQSRGSSVDGGNQSVAASDRIGPYSLASDKPNLSNALIPSQTCERLAKEWLREDVPSFDFAGSVVGTVPGSVVASLLGKSDGVLAGVPFANAIFEQCRCTATWLVNEGQRFAGSNEQGKRKLLATVSGRACDVMRAERIVLNVLSRTCGIALKARSAADVARAARFHGSICGTRKTTPGFRIVEKHALLVGGVDPHRMDLSSMVMLKDNHIAAAGGQVSKAVAMARAVCGFSVKIEVECGSLEEGLRAGAAGADVIMLDNMKPAELKDAARQLKAAYPGVTIECSGGITPETMRGYFCPHIDVLSMGCLTQGVPHVDISLKINPTRAHAVIKKRRSTRSRGKPSPKHQ